MMKAARSLRPKFDADSHNLRTHGGFTLMELVIVLVIVAILALMSFAIYGRVRDKVEKSACISNLKSLHGAFGSYTNDHGEWPQIPLDDIATGDIAQWWIESLKDYGISEKNWHCPTITRKLKKSGATEEDMERIDYMPTPFSGGEGTPYRWSTQPWMLEAGDQHGGGPLAVFSDGRVEEMSMMQFVKE